MTTPTCRFTAVAGSLYMSAGILGLALTGTDHLTAATGPMLGVFRVNGLLSLAHLVAGIALLLGFMVAGSGARTVTLLASAAFGVFGLLGLAMLTTGDGNVLALNGPDTLAHLVTSIIAALAIVIERAPGGAHVRSLFQEVSS